MGTTLASSLLADTQNHRKYADISKANMVLLVLKKAVDHLLGERYISCQARIFVGL